LLCFGRACVEKYFFAMADADVDQDDNVSIGDELSLPDEGPSVGPMAGEQTLLL
jgi:hypothetical protein